MERKTIQYIPIKGMSKDLSISKFQNEISYDNYNIRVNSYDDNSLFTISNEKGNVVVNSNNIPLSIEGMVIGYCVVQEILTLFTTTRDTTTILKEGNVASAGTDRIYKIVKDADFDTTFNVTSTLLYEGISDGTTDNSLNFSKDNFIETLGVLESDDVIKVYFVDSNNQPRFINLEKDPSGYNKNSFDFNPELDLNESITVNKVFSGGTFHSGEIQYAFSYWNKNGTETNLFYTSPLYDISNLETVGGPEDTCTCSFVINITNFQEDFDYIRVYAIMRTSLDGTPIARVVKDVKITDATSGRIRITDDGIIGSSFPVDALPYIGGEELVVGTITTKDNVLFGGNVTLKRPSLEGVDIKGGSTFSWLKNRSVNIQYYSATTQTPTGDAENVNSVYNYDPYTLKDNNYNHIRHWKKGETYRVGVQAQYKTGIWSEVIWVGDFIVDKGYATITDSSVGFALYTRVDYTTGEINLTQAVRDQLTSLGFKKVRPVYVPLTNKDRHITGQGVLTNTLANVKNRMLNSPFAYTDYMTRGNMDLTLYGEDTFIHRWENVTAESPTEVMSLPIGQHFSPLHTMMVMTSDSSYTYEYNEIEDQPMIPDSKDIDALIYGKDSTAITDPLYFDNFKKLWFVDTNLLNFWGPDIESDLVRTNLDNVTTLKLRGSANISAASNILKVQGENNETDGWNYTFPNYDPGAARFSPWTGLELDDKLTSFTLKPLWGSEIANTFSGTTKILNKDYSRFVYCGFNDMFLDGTSDWNLDIYKPEFIDTTETVYNYNTDPQDGATGNVNYMSSVDEVIAGTTAEEGSAIKMSYSTNKHLLLSLKNSKTLPVYFAGADAYAPLPKPSETRLRLSFDKPYYRNNPAMEEGTGFTTDVISNQAYIGIDDLTMRRRFRYPYGDYGNYYGGYVYLWIVDLYKDVTNQYGGNDVDAITFNTWIPCGEPVSASLGSMTLDKGDTYIQRYDVLRTARNQDNYQTYTEVLSVLLESFTNIDARYDTKRSNLNISPYKIDNYTHVNPVYSQKDNLFNYSIINYDLVRSDNMPTSFLWSNTKTYSELIDSWTSLNLNKSYQVDGVLGPINFLDIYKNELYGFQDKGIFNILYNQRVQIPTSDTQPIEITNSGEVQGVRYLSKKIGASNKWAINQSSKYLYFIDNINKDLCILNDPITNLSESLYFKTWFNNNISTINPYSGLNRQYIILNTDIQNDDVYINSEKFSLGLSERLNIFESFLSYEDIPFMFNIWENFLSVKHDTGTSSLWVNKRGDYNNFFGQVKPSSVEFFMNPDTTLDKVFDNIGYRADVFDRENNYLPRETFNTLEVENEFQSGSKNLMLSEGRYSPSVRKKFRMWDVTLPRQKGSLNRIRNPWLRLKLTFNNDSRGMKLLFHDLMLNYTI